MQAKGLVKFFAIALFIVCLFQLSFTLRTYMVEQNAEEFAENQVMPIENEMSSLRESQPTLYYDSLNVLKKRYKQRYIDSVSNETVYNLFIAKYNFEEIKDRQLNLGLDLQGGMSVILQVSVEDMLKNMAGNNRTNTTFNQALELAKEKQRGEETDFVTLFLESWNEIAPNAKMASVFANRQNQGIIEPDYSNERIAEILREEANESVDRTYQILAARIDQFGVTSPNISKIEGSERIVIELPGVDNPSRVRKLLQSVAQLEFWETYTLGEVYNFLTEADASLAATLELEQGTEDAESIDEPIDTTVVAEEPATIDTNEIEQPVAQNPDSNFQQQTDISDLLGDDTTAAADDLFDDTETAGNTPLLSLMNLRNDQLANAGLNPQGPVVAAVLAKDTARLNEYLNMEEVQASLPPDLKLLWGAKADPETGFYNLYAIRKSVTDERAPLEGDVITDARQDFDQGGNPNVLVSMNSEGAAKWQKITAANAGKGYIAIVLDELVYSAPFVRGEIGGGNTEITGNFEVKEAKDLANILKAGKLPAPAKIVQESQVGPTLGKESIEAGLLSMAAGLILVLLFMIFYYSNSGIISNLALIINIFFIFGILASLGATLTLPGIAGIVLTIGMAVDANVIIFERIREEILRGKGTRLAIVDGYKNSYSAIIDANVTTLITAGILFYFGMGPVLGFATVLMIGIFSSLFTAVLLTRLVYDHGLKKDWNFKFGNKLTLGALQNINIDFLSKRKAAYVFSGILIVISLVSFFTKGFELGVDFKGGRSYEVAFNHPVVPTDVRNVLTAEFGQQPIVKTVGANNQLKITTSYMIDSSGTDIDSMVQAKLLTGLESFYDGDITMEQFQNSYLRSYTKVEPTIADDIQRTSLWATIFALMGIFLYILFRFRKWQYSVGAIAALFHDVIITLGVFSIFSGILPFSLEIDQVFIAAILTVIGYSINDTVIVFDRVREYLNEHMKGGMMRTINTAINTTLSRTLITSGTTLIVILILFIFGGEVIRGFAFAILIGIFVGTYSSVFVATPLTVDLSKDEDQPETKTAKKEAVVKK